MYVIEAIYENDIPLACNYFGNDNGKITGVTLVFIWFLVVPYVKYAVKA